MAGAYNIISEADRRSPDDTIVGQIRSRYPVEPEIDKILTRKMARRHEGSGYNGVTLDRLADDAHGLLQHLGIARTHWLGLSMGGMIGQALTAAGGLATGLGALGYKPFGGGGTGT